MTLLGTIVVRIVNATTYIAANTSLWAVLCRLNDWCPEIYELWMDDWTDRPIDRGMEVQWMVVVMLVYSAGKIVNEVLSCPGFNAAENYINL